jgi:Zn-dependent M16 (insulinase) family peptidase
LCYSVIANWLYYGDPVETLLINERIERLRREMEDSSFFASRIQRYFLENRHKITLIMTPDETYTHKQRQKEEERLAKIKETLTDAKKDELVAQYHSIEAMKVSQEQNKGLLPTLTMADIPRELPNPIVLQKNDPGWDIDWDSTNGIVYVSVLTPFMLDDIPVDLEQYMSMFASVLTRLGAADMDQYKLAEQIELYTGGIQCSIVLIPAIKGMSLQDLI